MAQTLDHEDRQLSWRGRAVDIERIEAELTKLRYLAGAPSDGGGEGFAVRTSLANMVVHADDDDTAAQASRVIEDLAGHHPSRALIIIANPTEDESQVDASLAAHCHLAPDMDQSVCCEEVTLRVQGRAAFHLRSIILPLLIPDLPVVVWWTGRLPDKAHLIEELCEVADHFVIDSARFSDQLGGLSRVRDLASLHDCAIGDLNFERVRAWRDLFEQYTSAGGLQAWLPDIESIELRYTAGPGRTEGQAILFLAWLARRCDWDMTSVAGRGAERLTLMSGGREVAVFLKHVNYQGVERGWLVSFKLAFDRNGEEAFFSVSRTGDPLHLTIRTERAGVVREDHVRIDASESQDVLMHQLDTAPHSPEFVQLLIEARALLQAAQA
jgi:glucose-6-phosphate dehydrogenase assembly protein OpcA